MRHDKMMSPIIAGLPSQAESEHYAVLFGYRDPAPRHSGLGIRGVRNPTLVSVYLEALERLYAAMTGPVFRRPNPRVDHSGKTAVYVFHIADRFASNSPFMMYDLDGIPYLGLPCRSADPTMQAAFHRAASEAVHEATHAFNWSARPYQGLREEAWHWFDEATAVFMERYLLAGNPDAIRFCLNWTDMPERPLDHRAGMYEAGMFATYLATRFGPGLISGLWTQSTRTETPLETLNRLMQIEEPALHTIDPTLCPVFAEYCLDSYFLWDHQSKGFALDVYIRFGKRALAGCAALAPGDSVIFENRVDHLGSDGIDHQRVALPVPDLLAEERRVGVFGMLAAVDGNQTVIAVEIHKRDQFGRLHDHEWQAAGVVPRNSAGDAERFGVVGGGDVVFPRRLTLRSEGQLESGKVFADVADGLGGPQPLPVSVEIGMAVRRPGRGFRRTGRFLSEHLAGRRIGRRRLRMGWKGPHYERGSQDAGELCVHHDSHDIA